MDKSLIPISQPDSIVTVYTGDDMQLSNAIIKEALSRNVFSDYHKEITDNTKARQHNDLVSFAVYLPMAHIERDVNELENNPESWRGIDAAIIKGFQMWLEAQGYAMGTINVRLSTIRKRCELVRNADIIDQNTLNDIRTVKNKSGKVARNVDTSRERLGIARRRGYKKAVATEVTTSQVFQLKHTSTHGRGKARVSDLLIQERDALLTGLIFEHALRCGEIAGLNIENFNLVAGTMTFYREKTDIEETHTLQKHARVSAEDYITHLARGIDTKLDPRTYGPLFTGYQGKRISKRAINERIKVLGLAQGIERLSPHDGRHYWAYDALRNNTPLDRVVSGGGWRSPHMALRYAKNASIANEGVKISEE